MPTVVAMATTGRLRISGRNSTVTLRAVLFDMDGTLVETEQLWGEAMFELAARLGGRMSDDGPRGDGGHEHADVAMEILHADLGVPADRGRAAGPTRPGSRTARPS